MGPEGLLAGILFRGTSNSVKAVGTGRRAGRRHPLLCVLDRKCPACAVLWNGGISFVGVVAFLFADLIVLPILDNYRKYYGPKIGGFLLDIFYVSMALAALRRATERACLI